MRTRETSLYSIMAEAGPLHLPPSPGPGQGAPFRLPSGRAGSPGMAGIFGSAKPFDLIRSPRALDFRSAGLRVCRPVGSASPNFQAS
jgi:hypothetical protein